MAARLRFSYLALTARLSGKVARGGNLRVMEFRVLGPIELREGGHRIELGGRRQRVLLAALLVHADRVVHADTLIDVLWRMRPPPGARNTLHSYVSRLRKRFAQTGEDGLLETRPDGYLLKVPTGQLDARRFEDLVAKARKAAPLPKAELLHEALSLWRGAPYADLEDQEFVRPEVVRLEELRCITSEDRVDALFALGRHRETIGELEAATAAHPLRERTHAQLALALYRSGRQNEGLAVLRRFKQRLTEELGVDASPEIHELERDLLRHAPNVQPLRGTSITTAPEQRRTIPAETPQTSFVGREAAVDAVTDLLRRHRLVTLTGTGGVGKTRLAEEVAVRLTGDYADGITCCRLAPVRDLPAVPAAVAASIGVPQLGTANLEETLLTTLEPQEVLLVVDNCEHLLPAIAPLLNRIVRRCQKVRVLATSRERLCINGERVWEVPPLAVPNDVDLRTLSNNPSIRLFCDRAVAVYSDFRLDTANADAICELCRRLDGVPLALELAAARAGALPPAAMLSRLDRRFSLLTGGPRVEGERHRTLRGVVEWSYRLLSENEKLLFDRLSVFAGGFSLEAAEAVCSGGELEGCEIAGLLATLVDKSMLVAEQGEGVAARYRLLETLREYATARLTERGQGEQLRRAHAEYYAWLVEKDAPHYRGRDDARFVGEVEREYDNLRVAVLAGLEVGDVDTALRIPVALYHFALPGLRDEVFTWARRAVDLSNGADHPFYASACACAAQGLVNRAQSAEAHRYLERALETAGKDDHLARLHAWDVFGILALYEGRLDECLRISRDVIALAERTGHDYFAAWARIRQVLAHTYLGDADAALQDVARLHGENSVSDSRNIMTWTSYVHGEALLDVDPERAQALLQRAVEDAHESDNRFAEGVALVSLASVHGRLGEWRSALERFRQVILHWRRLGNRSQQWTTLRNLIELLVRLEVDEPACVLLGAVAAAEAARPPFGAEAQRLQTARATAERRLGVERASTALERGRRMTPNAGIEYALTEIDRALGTRT